MSKEIFSFLFFNDFIFIMEVMLNCRKDEIYRSRSKENKIKITYNLITPQYLE